MAEDKNQSPKTPQPQNTDAPERPKMPENRIVHGENKVPDRTILATPKIEGYPDADI
jgi:hypothetical protein